MINVGFLPGAHASVDFTDDVFVDEFEKNHARPRIEHLLRCCPIASVFCHLFLACAAHSPRSSAVELDFPGMVSQAGNLIVDGSTRIGVWLLRL